jgi:hypothetical protein
MILSLSLSYIAFIILRYIPSISSLFRALIMEGYEILWHDHGVFVLDSIYVYWFVYLNIPCIPGVKATWLLCMIFFDGLLDLVCKHFIEDFCVMFLGKLDSFSFYFWNSLRSIGVSSLKNWYNSAIIPCRSCLFFVGRLFVTVSISS